VKNTKRWKDAFSVLKKQKAWGIGKCFGGVSMREAQIYIKNRKNTEKIHWVEGGGGCQLSTGGGKNITAKESFNKKCNNK